MARAGQSIGDCGHPFGDDFEWPGREGRTICHPCFEAEVSEEWWEAVAALKGGSRE